MTEFFSDTRELSTLAGIGLLSAKEIVKAERLRTAVRRASTVEQLKFLLLEILDSTLPHPPSGFYYMHRDNRHD